MGRTRASASRSQLLFQTGMCQVDWANTPDCPAMTKTLPERLVATATGAR